RPVGLPRKKAAIDRAWPLGAALVRLGCRGKDIVAHFLPEHLRLPAKYVFIELRHAFAVVVGHFEVNHRVHTAHDGSSLLIAAVCSRIPSGSPLYKFWKLARFPIPDA